MEWEELHQGIGGGGETLFIGENVLGQYLLVNYKCPGRHYSPVNNVRAGNIFGGIMTPVSQDMASPRTGAPGEVPS